MENKPYVTKLNKWHMKPYNLNTRMQRYSRCGTNSSSLKEQENESFWAVLEVIMSLFLNKIDYFSRDYMVILMFLTLNYLSIVLCFYVAIATEQMFITKPPVAGSHHINIVNHCFVVCLVADEVRVR